MQRKIRRYGWQPDLPDQRDFKLKVPSAILRSLPLSVDLRKKCPPIYEQEIGDCTGNAIAFGAAFDLIKEKKPVFAPSRLFIYYNERVMENSVSEDAGAMIRDGIKSISKEGVCSESTWGYDVSKFATKPTDEAYTEALNHRAIIYERVARSKAQIKGVLASGYPFIFGFTVYESFESEAVERTGKVPMPSSGEHVIGGHAVAGVGYDRHDNIIGRNSWGTSWGKKGYFTMPFDYLLNPDLSDDFWVIKSLE